MGLAYDKPLLANIEDGMRESQRRRDRPGENPEKKTWPQAIAAAIEVAQAVRDGKTALVTCGQGYNRSGLVVALALRFLGYETDEAVKLIRAARGRNGIRNRTFLKFVRAFKPEDHAVP